MLEVFKNHKIIKIFQKENYEFSRAEKFINNLKERLVKTAMVLVRASPIMETLTGIMIAGLIYYSGNLIMKQELLQELTLQKGKRILAAHIGGVQLHQEEKFYSINH